MAKTVKRRPGRPRRTDSPVPIRVLLPGELRQWLRVRAAIDLDDSYHNADHDRSRRYVAASEA